MSMKDLLAGFMDWSWLVIEEDYESLREKITGRLKKNEVGISRVLY